MAILNTLVDTAKKVFQNVNTPQLTTPKSPQPQSGFTSSDPAIQAQIAAMQKQAVALSSQANNPAMNVPKAPTAPTAPVAPTAPQTQLSTPKAPTTTSTNYERLSVPQYNADWNKINSEYENVRNVGSAENPLWEGVKIPKATLINPQGQRVVVRTDNKPGSSTPTAQEYFAKGYVLETAPGVYKDSSGKTSTFGASVLTPKPPAPPPVPTATASGGSASLPAGYVRIPGTYGTRDAQRAAFDDIQMSGTGPGSFLYGRPKAGVEISQEPETSYAPPAAPTAPVAPTAPSAFTPSSDAALADLLRGHLSQNILSPEDTLETINSRPNVPDVAAEEFNARLNEMLLERENQLRALENDYFKQLAPSAEETEAQKAIDELIATQRNLQSSEELGINEIKKQPIAMGFLAGQSAAVQRDAAAKMNALSAQSEPLKAKLAAAASKRAAALEVSKERLGMEKERLKEMNEQSKPIEIGSNLVRFNPITKKYEVVYQGAKSVAPVSVAPGNVLVDPLTGKVIYNNPKADAATQTNDIKEYEYAQVQGYKGSFQDWLKVAANLKDQAGGGFKNETDLRKEFNALDSVKQYNDLRRSFMAMNSSLQEALSKGDQNSKAAADQALVTLYNKMLDPSSVVREGEYARSFDGQSALSRVVGYMEQIKQGGAGLTDSNRADMVQVAQRLMSDAQGIYNQNTEFYTNIAKSYGLDPNRIIMEGSVLDQGSPTSGATNPQEVSEAALKYGASPQEVQQLFSILGRDTALQFLEQRKKAQAPSTGVVGAASGVGTGQLGATRTVAAVGGAGDLNRFVQAIGQFESGGNYKAIGKKTAKGDRAYGKYQVMGANIPAWSKEVLGRSITKDEFLNSPEIQDKIATVKLHQYLTKYGNFTDATSSWFSGKPAKGNFRKDVNGTTVPAYIANVKAIYERMV